MYQRSPEGRIEPILGGTSGNGGFDIEIRISACSRFFVSSRILRMNAEGISRECSKGNAIDAELSVLKCGNR